MAGKTLWSVIRLLPSFLYIFFVLPWILLYLGVRNIYMKLYARTVLRRTLRKTGMPTELVNDVMDTYKEQMSKFSLRNAWKMRNEFT